MRLKAIVDEDFQDYKKTALFLATAQCDFKCCREGGFDTSVCQNSSLATASTMDVPDKELVDRYLANPLSKAIVFGGLEPFLQFGEMISLIRYFRARGVMDDIVIYTGYEVKEILPEIKELLTVEGGKIILKLGRYKPNQAPHYDELLGVMLANDEQHAIEIGGIAAPNEQEDIK